MIVNKGGAGGGGGGGSLTAEVVIAAIADAVGDGNIPLVDGDTFVGLPVIEGVAATAWDLLTGDADGTSDQGAALKAWMDAQEPGAVIASGLCVFTWPTDADGQRNHTGYQRWDVDADDDDAGTVSLVVSSRPAAVLAVDQALTIAMEVYNNTGAALTVQLAAPAGGRETVVWAEGNENVSLANAETAVVYVNCYPDRCIAHVEIESA